MNISEMNKVSPAPSITRPILKRRSLLTQKNADLRLEKPSYMNLGDIEGSCTGEPKESNDCSQSFCKIGGDSGADEHSSQIKSKKSVRFVTGTEFYERNMNSTFWRNIEKRRRYYNYSLRNVDSLAHLRRRRTHFAFSPHVQTWVRGQSEAFANRNAAQHFYYYRPSKNSNATILRQEQDSTGCCLESLSRQFRNLVCCLTGEQVNSNDCDMVDAVDPGGSRSL